MRTLTPTLLAAQRALGGAPAVRLRVEDRELRWQPLLTDDHSTRLTTAGATAGAILRARIGGGTLDVQRITSPEEPAQWQAWTTLLTGVAPASDLALSTVDGDPDRVRLFFVRGAGPYSLSWVQSADGGVTWSPPEDLLAGLAIADRGLAGANGQLVYHDPATDLLTLAVRAGWDAGAWATYPWAAGGALAVRYGLAAGYSAGVYYLATCDQESAGAHRLRTGTCTVATGVWSDPVAIVPPGPPASGFVPRYPSLVRAGGLWHLAYLETFSGVLNHAAPMVIHSADWEHWSFACWVPLEGQTPEKRAALVHYEGVFYLAMECGVWRAAAYDAADPDRHLEETELLGYVVEEQPWYGAAWVDLHNPAGRYRAFGTAGEAGAPIRPLARVTIERGYRTSQGEERVARPPYYLVAAGIRRGGARPALRLECEDGWGLLRRWRPDALYQWSGKSIRWLIAEILYRAAGLEATFDEASGWDTVLTAFALGPTQWGETLPAPQPVGAHHGSGLGAIRTLLAKVSGAARWLPDGSLHCFVPAAQALYNPYAIGAAGEICDAFYARGLMWPTQARVFGEGVSAAAAAPEAQGSPRRFLATEVDTHLDTVGECADRARGLVYAGQARRCAGWLEVPCLLGLDLYDLVSVDDPHAPLTPNDWLRVAGIVERYEPGKGVFVTRAAVEGV